MTVLKLQLLGDFQALDGAGHAVDVLAKKGRVLLAALALSPSGCVSRQRLAELFWGDRGDEQARSSLRQVLASLRRDFASLDAQILSSDDETVTLDLIRTEIDACNFQRLARSDHVNDLRLALDLYRGDLLTGTTVRESEFEAWHNSEQARLHSLAVASAEKLWSLETGANRITIAKRLIVLEPLKESLHHALMQSYVEFDENGLALQHYSVCRDLLKAELGIVPGMQIEILRQKILDEAKITSIPSEKDNSISLTARGAQGGTAAFQPSAELSNRPSIAVLPFHNLSGDPEQEYFADGIVEEITIALSQARWLFVIDRNSSFSYKARTINVKDVGRGLGVRYVLEGSVRKAANRLRIAAQLIDTGTGVHLWADRFEGNLEDIFDLQDRVTSQVVGAIAPRLEAAEIERVRRKPTASLDAYDHFLRGIAGLHRWSRAGNDEALIQFNQAIRIDPLYAAAYGLAARTYVQRRSGAWMIDRNHEIVVAEKLARQAIILGHDDAVALCTAGFALADFCEAIPDGDAMIDRSIVLNANLARAWLYSGWVKASLGEADLALERLARARQLSPLDPQDFSNRAAMGFAHFVAARYGEALFYAEAAALERPGFLLPNLIAATAAGLAGRDANARRAMLRVRENDPSLRLSNVDSVQPMRPEDFKRWVEGLKIAGLPE